MATLFAIVHEALGIRDTTGVQAPNRHAMRGVAGHAATAQ